MEAPGRYKGASLLCFLLSFLSSTVQLLPATPVTPSLPVGAIFRPQTSKEMETALNYSLFRHNLEDTTLFNMHLVNGTEVTYTADPNNTFHLMDQICQELKEGVLAMFVDIPVMSWSAAQDLSNSLHIPFITTGYPFNSSAQPAFQIRMRPPIEPAILAVVRHYNWKKVYYLYDSDEGLVRLQRLFQLLALERLAHLDFEVHRITGVEDTYELLRQIDIAQSDRKHIIIDCFTIAAQNLLLKQISDVGMNRVQYHFLIAGMNIHALDLERFRYGGVNVTSFRIIDPDRPSTKQFIVEWKHLDKSLWPGAGQAAISLEAALLLDGIKALLLAMKSLLKTEPELFRSNFRRRKLYNQGQQGIACDRKVSWEHGKTIMKKLLEVEHDGLTGLINFDSFGFRKNYSLDVMEIRLDRSPSKVPFQVGQYSTADGLKLIQWEYVRPKANHTIINRTRVLSSILAEPYLMYRKQPEDGPPLTGNDRFEGYCSDLVKKLAEIVGFEYIIRPVKDGSYGAQEPDGRWNGMVGELVRHEADLAVAPLTISSMRERVIDFSKPFMSLGISIMIKKPEKQKPGVFSFMDPLSYEIWMCVIFAYSGVSVVLFLVSRFSPYEWHLEGDVINGIGPTATNDFTIFNSLWFSLGAFMQQGCDISPRSVSGRIVASVWWFFTLILISSYTANLAAFLTVERMVTPIESADDLSKQTEIQYGTVDSGSTKEFFRTSKIPVYQRMWAFMSTAEPSVFVSKVDEGIERVRSSKGKYAFLLESTWNDYINERKPCNTMKVGGNLDSKGYGVATPLGSDLKDAINLAVLQLREDGFLHELQTKWWYDRSECGGAGGQSQTKQDASQSALTLSNVAGIFYILIGGLLLSMIIALSEFCYKSRVEARKAKTSLASAIKSKMRLSIRGQQEQESKDYNGQPELMRKSLSSYHSYTSPSQVIMIDGFGDPIESHTQV